MNLLLDATGQIAEGGPLAFLVSIVPFLILGVFFYFVIMRPQKKEQKRLNAMINDMAIGDCVLTTSGFYGTVIDITDDTVIVEFGNNKNCRIPMQKSAITQVEKAEQ
ncbi:MAG: preprotein translocase subunit YajC [Lachnospiraceae bacterium]|nr:preprotein translocase subunit YajC [Lachnospiraceae bacterium]